jgi:hypothetical protein
MKTVAWLPPEAREWVDLYGYFLEGVWTRFEKDGDWPDPVEVQRELRCADSTRRVTLALNRMPKGFARREYAPPKLALTIFGLGCCEGARLLLEQYLNVAKLALQRFDSPALPNRLRREDVISELDLSPAEADSLSIVLAQYAPFLGGGEISVDSWDREIHPQAEEFEGIEDVDDLLDFEARKQRLAEVERGSAAPAVPFSTSATSHPPARNVYNENLMLGATVTSAAVAVITLVLMVASAPSAPGLALVGLSGGLTAALLLFRRKRIWGVALVVSLTMIGGLVGFALEAEPVDGSFHYFVASTGGADVLVTHIEPDLKSAMGRERTFVSGDPVQIACFLSNDGIEWAKLTDGTFVPAGLLSQEVGGDPASSC